MRRAYHTPARYLGEDTPGVSEQNMELARRAFDAFAERDADALVALMHEDVEFLPVTANLTTGGMPYRGHTGVARYLEDVGRVWNELRVFPTEFRDAGDCVVALGRIRARGGGMIIDRPTGWVWRMRDGKIHYGRVYASHEEALRDAGLDSQ
jgi:ketosteroid isomerase-like protein